MLRVVQEKKLRHLGGKKDIDVDVRIITASNVNLHDAVKSGRLRADLYHRLNEFVINVPPLRERREDIPVLAQQFLLEANNEMQKNIAGFSSEAIKLLLNTVWSGNVRELKNVVKKAVLLAEGDMIKPADVLLDEVAPSPVAVAVSGKQSSIKIMADASKQTVEKEIIRKVLSEAGDNKAKAARILKIDRGTLYAKIRKYKLSRV
jgi:transcriptional regulator with PAS, ATPase and Fis domain